MEEKLYDSAELLKRVNQLKQTHLQARESLAGDIADDMAAGDFLRLSA